MVLTYLSFTLVLTFLWIFWLKYQLFYLLTENELEINNQNSKYSHNSGNISGSSSSKNDSYVSKNKVEVQNNKRNIQSNNNYVRTNSMTNFNNGNGSTNSLIGEVSPRKRAARRVTSKS